MELKNFLSRWSAESRVFLSRCISRERSEDTLQRLLEKVNRVPLHEDFHFRVTNGQRAEVKRACTAKEYLCFPRPLCHIEVFCFPSVSPQQLQISLTSSHKLTPVSLHEDKKYNQWQNIRYINSCPLRKFDSFSCICLFTELLPSPAIATRTE